MDSPAPPLEPSLSPAEPAVSQPLPIPPPVPIPPKPFPGLAQALLVMALLMLCQVVLAAVVWILDAALSMKLMENAAVLGVINLLSFGAVCWQVGRRMGVPLLATLSRPPLPGTFSSANVLTLCSAIAGQLMCAVGCVYAIGGKGIERSPYVERLNDLMGPGQAWWIVVPLLVVVAPLTEETLFRGQFLHGFLNRYAAPVSIGASAAFFSLMHLNPVQIPATFMLGVLTGVLYERTRSVWPSIFAHMLNNAVPAMAVLGAGVRGAKAARAAKNAFDPTLGGMLALVAVGLLVWLAALATLRRSLPAQPTPSSSS